MEKIKEYIRKEIIFQNLQNNKKQAEIALEILIRTGFIDIPNIIKIKQMIREKELEIIKKEKLMNEIILTQKKEKEIILTEY